jgi:hypothetical protein
MNEPFYKTMPEYARSTMNRRRNLCRKREGRQLFLIIIVSYNARYAKYREVKKATFPVFEPFSAVWLHLGSADSLSLVLLWLSFLLLQVLFYLFFHFHSNAIFLYPFAVCFHYYDIMIFSRRGFLFTVHIGFANTIKKLPASICLSDSVCQEFQSFICVK